MKPKVAVIGGGVIGLSSAVLVAENDPDIEVTVLSDKWTPHTTGDGSAGFLHPYLLGKVSRDTIRHWFQQTLEFATDLYRSPEASSYGVGLAYAYHLFTDPEEEPDFSDMLLNCRQMNAQELALFPSKYKHGVFLTSFYIECQKFLPMLMKRLQSKGGKLLQKKVESIHDLSGEYDIVINCSGLGAAQLVPDPAVQPIRGQVIKVYAPWIKHGVMFDHGVYILPNSESLTCGGTHQEGDWNLEVDAEDRQTIWQACTDILPSLKGAKILREWVGLRPGRPSLRLERETLETEKGKLEVIHNYGHGGSGVTIAWGCAHSVLELFRQIRGSHPTP